MLTRLLLALALLLPISASAGVRVYLFTSPDCTHCAVVQDENLRKVAEKVGCTLEIERFDIEEMENYERLVEMEERYGDTGNKMPVLFVGDDVLGGEQEITERLEQTLAKYVEKPAQPVREKPTLIQPVREEPSLKPEPAPAPPAPKTPEFTPAPEQEAKGSVYAAFFYQTGCRECDRVFYLMKYLKKKYPNLTVREYDLAKNENKVLYEAVAAKWGLQEKKRLLPATIFIGSDYFQKEAITESRLEVAVAKWERVDCPKPWNVKVAEVNQAEKRIVKRFTALDPAAVAVAGMVDGVNPCAFTTLVFFVSYLAYIGRKKRDILIVGLAFAAGVFGAYFAIGCGALRFLDYLSKYHGVTRGVNIAVAAGALTLAAVSFADFLKARRGKISEMGLQLPLFLKKRIHKEVRRSAAGYALSALFAGAVISVLELACTGQVYLPTIIFVAKREGMRSAALGYLAFYNLMFILPLVGVLAITYRGANSQMLADLSKKHAAPAKLATALLFAALGVLLLRL